MKNMKEIEKKNNYIALIGDIHEEMYSLSIKMKEHYNTISTEWGFKGQHNYFLNFLSKIPWNHWLLPGNHDYFPYQHKDYFLPTWHYIEEFDLFLIRGAWSVDQYRRTEGTTWFAEEEMTYKEALDVFDNYKRIKPKNVFSHDVPQSVKEDIFGYTNRTITNQLLQHCLEEHAPKEWVHGHYHITHTTLIDKTTYIGLAPLEVYQIFKNENNSKG